MSDNCMICRKRIHKHQRYWEIKAYGNRGYFLCYYFICKKCLIILEVEEQMDKMSDDDKRLSELEQKTQKNGEKITATSYIHNIRIEKLEAFKSELLDGYTTPNGDVQKGIKRF